MLIPLTEAARRLACSPRHVRRLIAGGQLQAVRIGSSAKSDRISEQELAAFIERRQHAGPCLSNAATASGTSDFKWTDAQLDALLAREQPALRLNRLNKLFDGALPSAPSMTRS